MSRKLTLVLALVALMPVYRLARQSFWYDELLTDELIGVGSARPAETL